MPRRRLPTFRRRPCRRPAATARRPASSRRWAAGFARRAVPHRTSISRRRRAAGRCAYGRPAGPAGWCRHEPTMTIRILALVGDCYGAQGGIARYNQDLFEALAHDGAEIVILPRLGDAAGLSLPRHIRQNPPIFGPLRFSIASLAAAWLHRPVNVVFCGHVFMAPLAWLLARLFGARYWLQAHGIDILPLGRGRMRRAV